MRPGPLRPLIPLLFSHFKFTTVGEQLFRFWRAKLACVCSTRAANWFRAGMHPVPLTAVKIGKFRPFPEPIRLQDSVHLARSRAEKKINYSYPITKKITLKYEKTFVDEHNAEEVLNYALRDVLGTKVNSSTIDWTGLRNFSMEDILKIGGHQIKEMMKACLWRVKNATIEILQKF